MHIALLTDGIYPYVIGGMQKHSHYLAKFLVRRGHKVTLVHAIPQGKKLPTEDEVRHELGLDGNSDLHVISIHFPAKGWLPGHYLKESYSYSHSVFNRIRQQIAEFDFVYAKGFSAWYLLAQRKKGLKTPPIGVKFHGYEMFQKAADFKSKLQHFLLRGAVQWNSVNADYVFSYGGKISEIIRSLGISSDRIIEVPTGIEEKWCAEHIKEQEGPVNFVFIGRYERRKGIIELTDILRNFDLKGNFHFIGPIPSSRQIRKPGVIYHGALSDPLSVQKILDQSHVLVVPSWSEGMPNVILEGMSRGLAIIASDVGAIKDMVSDQNGWLVEAGDKDMLKKCMTLASAIDWRVLSGLRHSSVSIVRSRFLWDRVAENLENALWLKLKA